APPVHLAQRLQQRVPRLRADAAGLRRRRLRAAHGPVEQTGAGRRPADPRRGAEGAEPRAAAEGREEVTRPTPPFPHSVSRPAVVKLGGLSLRSRYTLAPLAGYTNLAFRLAVRGVGPPGLATTDLVNARALLIRSRKTMDLIKTCPEDRPL